MPDLLPVTINGHMIYIEAEPSYGIEDTTSADKALDYAEDAFERAKTTVTSMAQGMVGAIRALDRNVTPDEFTMEFAIKFTAEGNVVVAKAGAEANLTITMKYQHTKAD